LRVSLLMNVTREPTGTVICDGLTPFAVIVIVFEAVGGLVGFVGVVGVPPPPPSLPPPQATAAIANPISTALRTVIRSSPE
jgi:hypothetical protein